MRLIETYCGDFEGCEHHFLEVEIDGVIVGEKCEHCNKEKRWVDDDENILDVPIETESSFVK